MNIYVQDDAKPLAQQIKEADIDVCHFIQATGRMVCENNMNMSGRVAKVKLREQPWHGMERPW